ncbi:hypothetical protein AAY473_001276 [Plecturocebus cupreus]
MAPNGLQTGPESVQWGDPVRGGGQLRTLRAPPAGGMGPPVLWDRSTSHRRCTVTRSLKVPALRGDPRARRTGGSRGVTGEGEEGCSHLETGPFSEGTVEMSLQKLKIKQGKGLDFRREGMLEFSGVILAHCNPYLLGSNDSPTSPPGFNWDHRYPPLPRLGFVFVVEAGFHHVGRLVSNS